MSEITHTSFKLSILWITGICLPVICTENNVWLQKSHLSILMVKPSVVNFPSTVSRCLTCSSYVFEYTMISSTQLRTYPVESYPRTSYKALIKLAKELWKTNGTLVNWYVWPSKWKAVHIREDSSNGICRNVLLRSIE